MTGTDVMEEVGMEVPLEFLIREAGFPFTQEVRTEVQ